ncbi:N,N-dimethylformamidase beta subunit family domain-containing protein [Mycolicibacterium fluoranthenivorans]|uniref:N,N-dimethylformamidase n=1 Tax=Mycolicibacterium fluoranthenivorans TaxID=258505 RepID=A0A1G4WXY7_9MYCO|nr:N,N-dimethylformamidase beta subunit family domain-containing protein [Mycolicibacterium fluoranthenivorans]SCX31431.1 N,N-dimethylformamidase [Mycolicibacterium fluoranthenivorans]
MELVGYADKLSVAAGDKIAFMISAAADTFDAELVRLIHGDVRATGPGFKADRVPASFSGTYAGVHQKLLPGSYGRITDGDALRVGGTFTIQMWIMPTRPRQRGIQTLCSKGSDDGRTFALRLEDACVVLDLGPEQVRTRRRLQAGIWYSVAVTVSSSAGIARLAVKQCSGIILSEAEDVTQHVVAPPGPVQGDLLFAAERETGEHGSGIGCFFNGKIDTPRLYDQSVRDDDFTALLSGNPGVVGTAPIGIWDFSLDISSSKISDISGNHNHGEMVNRPTRGVTGRNWDGSQDDWRHARDQYGAVHFHDDDLSDAGWIPSFEWTVPAEIGSGVYAARLSGDGGAEDYIPFAIVPTAGKPQARVALVLPTFSYLAYGNEQMAEAGTLAGLVDNYPRLPEDQYIVDNRLISLYDKHSDGSSVCYASWLRPIVNMRPKYTQHWLDSGAGSPHLFPADLHLVDWLVTMGYQFDVLTDLEVHRDGVEILEPYDVVLTGTHAEYTSGVMLNAYQGYLNGGGRLMYLSGNGFYWVTDLDPDTGRGIEVRRRSSPAWTWPVPPGEAHLSSTGEPAGLWTWRGRSAQRWLGVGMNGEGDGPGRPFRRAAGSYDPRVAFAFEGIGPDEAIGDFPSLVNSWGAAGYEMDYSDARWGAPEEALVVATADDFGDQYATSANTMMGGPLDHPKVKSDLVFLEYPDGGAVFAFSSISWCACLSYNDYDNNVSLMTKNILDGFMAENPPWLTEDASTENLKRIDRGVR